MDEFQHLVLGNGHYRLFARSHRPQYAADAIFGYTVTTLAGDRLRDEPTLARALAWMDAHRARESSPQLMHTTGRIRRC
ncbi:MAG TPA: hypothetical protein VIP76_05265 [Luteimonas sp.]